jgi:exosortase/archaeosortase family protein
MIASWVSLLGLPLIEYVSLRLWLRHWLNLRPGWGPVLVDTDLFVTVPLAVFVWVWVTKKRDTAPLLLSWFRFGVHCAALLAFVALTALMSGLAAVPNFLWYVWWFSCLLSFVSASFIWISPQKVLREQKTPVLLIFFLSISTVIAKHIPITWTTWLDIQGNEAACFLSSSVFGFFPRCYQDCVSQTFIIHGTDFALRIGAGCRGYDGAITFLCLALIYLGSLGDTRRRPFVESSILTAGMIATLLFNPVRLSLLYVLGEFSSKYIGYGFAKNWVSGFFHLHLGLFFAVASLLVSIWVIHWMESDSPLPRWRRRKASTV